MIEPTVGRIVWFHANHRGRAKVPLAAIVAFVHNERLVNLGVFDPLGRLDAHCQVPLLQDDDPVPEEGSGSYAEWMPFQKGQAAKQDAGR